MWTIFPYICDSLVIGEDDLLTGGDLYALYFTAF